jgi:hypothetical protein
MGEWGQAGILLWGWVLGMDLHWRGWQREGVPAAP